jgi:hypothetical protein
LNSFKIIFQGLQQCLVAAPLPVVSLLLYLGLKSTTILEGGLQQFNGAYHPAYLGWYDLVLGYSIIFSFVNGSLKLKAQDLLFGLIGLSIISVSWIHTYESDKMFIVSGLVCFLRFALVFIYARALVRKSGHRTAENVLLGAYGILAISAVLWYSLQFGVQNRMAASAMTSASFGQVSAMMCLIFYARKYYFALFFSFIFLFLSFSRTSLLLFLLLIVIQNRQLIPTKLIKYVVVFIILGAVGIAALQQYGGSETQVVLESRTSTKEISNLNGRSEIWANALDQFKYGKVPLTGIGFDMTPSLITNNNLKFYSPDSDTFYRPPHYHSMLLEYTLSLGILAFPIFFYLIKRIWQTFQHNCSPAFFIFAFFLVSQSMDFSIFPPKEIIVFALMLGLAEGQFNEQTSEQILVEQKSFAPNITK